MSLTIKVTTSYILFSPTNSYFSSASFLSSYKSFISGSSLWSLEIIFTITCISSLPPPVSNTVLWLLSFTKRSYLTWCGLLGAELDGRSVKKLSSPSCVIELLQWVFREKRPFFSSFNLLLCYLQTLKAPLVHHLPLCVASLRLGCGSWSFSTCSLSSLRLPFPAQGLSDFIKGEAVNACIAWSDLPQQLCLFESVNLSVQIYLAQRGRATVTGGERLFYLVKSYRGDGFEKQSHPDGAIIFTLLFRQFVDNL